MDLHPVITEKYRKKWSDLESEIIKSREYGDEDWAKLLEEALQRDIEKVEMHISNIQALEYRIDTLEEMLLEARKTRENSLYRLFHCLL